MVATIITIAFLLAAAGLAAYYVITNQVGRLTESRFDLSQRLEVIERLAFDPTQPAALVAVHGYLGPWPPLPGTIMPVGFPESLLAAARVLHQATKQSTGSVYVQPTGGGDEDPSCPGKSWPQVLAARRGPDGDGLSGAELAGQGNYAQGVADDGHALAPMREQSFPCVAGRESDTIDRHLCQPEVGDANAKLPVGLPVEAVGKLSGETARADTSNANGVDHPHRLGTDAHPIALNSPQGVYDAEPGAERSGCDRYVLNPSHSHSPSYSPGRAYRPGHAMQSSNEATRGSIGAQGH